MQETEDQTRDYGKAGDRQKPSHVSTTRPDPPRSHRRFSLHACRAGLFKIASTLPRTLVTQLAVLLETLIDDSFQLGGHLRSQLPGGGCGQVQNAFTNGCDCASREGSLA